MAARQKTKHSTCIPFSKELGATHAIRRHWKTTSSWKTTYPFTRDCCGSVLFQIPVHSIFEGLEGLQWCGVWLSAPVMLFLVSADGVSVQLPEGSFRTHVSTIIKEGCAAKVKSPAAFPPSASPLSDAESLFQGIKPRHCGQCGHDAIDRSIPAIIRL